MGRVEDALERAAAMRGAGTQGLRRHDGLDGLATKGRYLDLVDAPRQREIDPMLVSGDYLDRFPEELVSPPPAPSPKPPQRPAPDPTVRAHSSKQTSTEPSVAHLPQPRIEVEAYEGTFDASVSEKVVGMSGMSPVAVEQYRKLAATLHQLQIERKAKVVMIASAVEGEGKTLTAMNLALTLSESFKTRVLLVDADLRRPRLHTLFQLSCEAGLNESLKASGELRLPVIQISPHLLLLPAGQPDSDPMRSLSSDRMRRVVSKAAEKFDWVIVDSPPVADLPDAHLLAAMVDLAVLVVAAGRTPHAAIARAVETIGRERVAGVLLNHVDEAALDAARAYTTVVEGTTTGESDEEE